jgi:hypothetical protein
LSESKLKIRLDGDNLIVETEKFEVGISLENLERELWKHKLLLIDASDMQVIQSGQLSGGAKILLTRDDDLLPEASEEFGL